MEKEITFWEFIVTPIIVAIIGVIGGVSIAVINSKLNTIHVLVNSRLSEALEKIDELQELLDK